MPTLFFNSVIVCQVRWRSHMCFGIGVEVPLGLGNHCPTPGLSRAIFSSRAAADSAWGRELRCWCTSETARVLGSGCRLGPPRQDAPSSYADPLRRHSPPAASEREPSRGGSRPSLLKFQRVPGMIPKNCKSHIGFQQKSGRRSQDSAAESRTLWGPIPPTTRWHSNALTAPALGEQCSSRHPPECPAEARHPGTRLLIEPRV